ncbi:tetratricopeptide repeat protein [Enhygromyxa salina]|uniref:tetratricopeptide repeat protein n=1 Tax=Enhygromyxa salina TaxID=215803 RepID=UPI0011B285C6|nr:hypothetical protein [Enhygromyxa salina]
MSLSCASASPARAAPPERVGPASDEAKIETEAGSETAPETGSETAPETGSETAPETAIEWYARGYELGNAGDYAAAAEAFLRSYDLQPTPEALFNAAFAFEQAGATLDAISTYERVLTEPARSEELAAEAQRSIDELSKEVAVLKGIRFAAARPPAQLFVQGRSVDLDAFPILVLPGEIELEVVDERGVRTRETYQLAAGEALVVDLRALLPSPPKPDPKPVLDAGPTETELDAARTHARLALALRNTTWVGVGLSGAGAVSVLSLALLAQREQRRFNADSCYQFPDDACPDDFELGDPNAHQRAYKRYALSASVAGGVSAGLVLTTLVVGLVSVRHARRAKHVQQSRGHEARSAVRVTPGVGLGSLMLRF